VDLLLCTASASKRFAPPLCVLYELHEYDQDEDSSRQCVPTLLLHDVFLFRKVLLVMIGRLGGLLQRRAYLAERLSWLLYLLWRSGQHCRLRIDQ